MQGRDRAQPGLPWVRTAPPAQMPHEASPVLPTCRAACSRGRSTGHPCLPVAVPAVTAMPLGCGSCPAPRRGSLALLAFEGQ